MTLPGPHGLDLLQFGGGDHPGTRGVCGQLADCGDFHAYAGAAEARVPQLLDVEGQTLTGKREARSGEPEQLHAVDPPGLPDGAGC
jgi:hypothetical protein